MQLRDAHSDLLEVFGRELQERLDEVHLHAFLERILVLGERAMRLARLHQTGTYAQYSTRAA